MTITIVGIGLIGGSLAISLRENGFADHIIGVDENPEHIRKAFRRRLIDENLPLEEAIAKSDLIIVATPVDSMLSLLPRILDLVTHQVVLEVGSTKSRLLEAVADHPRRSQFVATHPMAGTEYSGPAAALPDLFDGKCCVICEAEKSSEKALALALRLYHSLQMRIVYLNGADHDIHTAYVSHISHICSFALALTVLEKEKEEDRIFELASGGFSSTVRLAKSSPDTWIPIFRQNRDNVMDVLDEFIHIISKFRTLLIKKDFDTFYDMIQQSNDIRRILEKK